MTVHGLSRSIKRKRRSGENNREPITKEVMNLKDFLKQVLSAYSEENSDEKEENVGINMKKETPKETNEKGDTKIITDPENDEYELISKEVMNLKDFLKEVLGAYSEENSDKKEEKVGINAKNETPAEETNEEEDTKIIFDPEKDENEPGSGENKEKKIDKVNDNFEPIKAKSDEKGIVESSATKEEKGDEKGNEPGSEMSQLEDDEENSTEHFTKDDYEDYINDNMKLKGSVEEMSQEDGSSLSDDRKRNT